MTISPQDATILIVEDDEAVAKTFARVLGVRGYRVLVAQNSEEALRELDQSRPDAVIKPSTYLLEGCCREQSSTETGAMNVL